MSEYEFQQSGGQGPTVYGAGGGVTAFVPQEGPVLPGADPLPDVQVFGAPPQSQGQTYDPEYEFQQAGGTAPEVFGAGAGVVQFLPQEGPIQPGGDPLVPVVPPGQFEFGEFEVLPTTPYGNPDDDITRQEHDEQREGSFLPEPGFGLPGTDWRVVPWWNPEYDVTESVLGEGFEGITGMEIDDFGNSLGLIVPLLLIQVVSNLSKN